MTGGNGYLASWIVKFLLEEGHRVRATVRAAPDSARYSHLHRLSGEHGHRLSLHTAQLDDAGAFIPLADGCNYVIHAASPFALKGISDPTRELVRPAVDGTRAVLRAATRSSSVHRVVMTSSVAAIYGDSADAEKLGGRPFSEEDWNTTSSLEHQPYAHSKTLAERAAWEMSAEQSQWDLVALNPAFILGPAVSATTTAVSQTVMRNFADGTYRSGIIDVWYGLVDVRDVAQAHISACFSPKARGRYILSGEDGSLWAIAQQLRAAFGDTYPLPRRKAPKPILWLLAPKFQLTRAFVARNVGIPIHLDNRKSRHDLSVTYRPIAQTLSEHFHQVASTKSALTNAAGFHEHV